MYVSTGFLCNAIFELWSLLIMCSCKLCKFALMLTDHLCGFGPTQRGQTFFSNYTIQVDIFLTQGSQCSTLHTSQSFLPVSFARHTKSCFFFATSGSRTSAPFRKVEEGVSFRKHGDMSRGNGG